MSLRALLTALRLTIALILLGGVGYPAAAIATGPVVALEFIKQLRTNGGGFFNANGAPDAFAGNLAGALTFLPALALGPLAEHFQMRGMS